MSSLNTPIKVTHIGTATAILEVLNTRFLTDPFFSPGGTVFPIMGGDLALKITDTPALALHNLPPIDAILLSHEDHPDNLDPPGRQLLDGRHVFTPTSAAKTLAPRPGVQGLEPWETKVVSLNGREWEITGTPCVHLPGGDVVGFLLHTKEFGTQEGKKNAIWFTGDTIYIPEFAKIGEKWNVVVAMVNLGSAHAPTPDGGALQITMDGKQCARVVKELGVQKVLPMHFESWGHFMEGRGELEKVFKSEGVEQSVVWMKPGVEQTI